MAPSACDDTFPVNTGAAGGCALLGEQKAVMAITAANAAPIARGRRRFMFVSSDHAAEAIEAALGGRRSDGTAYTPSCKLGREAVVGKPSTAAWQHTLEARSIKRATVQVPFRTPIQDVLKQVEHPWRSHSLWA